MLKHKITFLAILGILAIPSFVIAVSYSAHFSSYIYSNGNPSYPSSLQESVNIPTASTYEVKVFFRADHGVIEEYEEFNVYVDGSFVGKTNDPNQGDDYANQILGNITLSAGNHTVKVQHAHDYSSVGYQGVYPLEVMFTFVSGGGDSNTAPIADAGPDRTTPENTTITLNNYSSDPDGDTITYKWECTGGTLSDDEAEYPDWTAPSVDSNTNYQCMLKVTDEHGLTDCDTVIITVTNYIPPTPSNNPPVADAGPDKTLYEDSNVTLQGSGSDPDGDDITFEWDCEQGNLSNKYIAQPTYHSLWVDTDTDYTCTLTVTDEHGLSASDTMNVTVLNIVPSNNPPVADAGPDREVDENDDITILGDGSDPDGDDITFDWDCTGGSLSDDEEEQPTFYAPSVSFETDYTCTLEVTDEHGLIDSDDMIVTVLNEQEALEVETRSAVNVEEHEATLRGDLQDLGNRDDADVYFQWGRTTSYGFETSSRNKSNEGDFDWDIYGLQEDTLYHFRAVAEDGSDRDYGQDRTFRTQGDSDDYPPVADAGPDKEVYEDDEVRLDGDGYDPDGGSVEFYWYCTRGTLDDQYDDRPKYDPRDVDKNTWYTCTLRVTDDENDTDTDTMRVLVKDRDTGDALEITKRVQNLSRGDSSRWYSLRSGDPLHIIKFKITIEANEDLDDVRVKDELPDELLYQGSLKVDGSSVSKDITDGIDIGDMDDGETIEITFLAKIANKDEFSYGTTDITNEVRVYTDDESETENCIVRVRKTKVEGITDIPTGVLGFSLLIPLLGAGLIVFVLRSKLVGLDEIVNKRTNSVLQHRADKKLKQLLSKYE